jgi:peptidyl-prolyl cis-trans isomerase C
MKKLLVALVATSCLLASPISAVTRDKTVVASYKTGEVKASQVMDFIVRRVPQLKGKKLSDFNPDVQNAFIKEYIYSLIVPVEAKNTGIDKSTQLREKISMATLELTRQELVNRYIKEHFKDDMIDKEYDLLVASITGKDEMKVWQLLVPTAKEAEEIKKDIQNSKTNFATAAQKLLDAEEERLKNTEDKTRRISGGPIGFFMPGQTQPDFDKEIFKYKEGDTAIIETGLGHHVIHVEARRKIEVPVKEAIKANLKQQIEARLTQEYFNSIDRDYKVTVTLATPEPANTNKPQ